MSAQFTPGPWEIEDKGYGFAISPNICWIGDCSSVPKAQQIANARLIVMTPRLYETLDRLTKALRDCYDLDNLDLDSDDTEMYWIGEFNEAMMALKQARGEE